jgi:hypothetical protein
LVAAPPHHLHTRFNDLVANGPPDHAFPLEITQAFGDHRGAQADADQPDETLVIVGVLRDIANESMLTKQRRQA